MRNPEVLREIPLLPPGKDIKWPEEKPRRANYDFLRLGNCRNIKEINTQDRDGRTYLWKAVDDGDINAAFTCLKAGVDPNMPDKRCGATPLMRAIDNGHMDIVLLLLKEGADVDAKGRNQETALMKACSGLRKDMINVVKLLLMHGADLHAGDYMGKNPLMYAVQFARGDDLEMINFLIKAGADIHAKDDHKNSILHYCDSPKMLKLFIDKGVHVGDSELIREVGDRLNGLERIKLLVELQSDSVDSLHEGAPVIDMKSRKHKKGAQYEIARGANVNAHVGNNEITALIRACQCDRDSKSNLEIIEYLVEKGAEINAQDKDGDTALIELCKRPCKEDEKIEIAQFLIKKGAKVGIKNKHGQTAWDIVFHRSLPFACESELSKILLEGMTPEELKDAAREFGKARKKAQKWREWGCKPRKFSEYRRSFKEYGNDHCRARKCGGR